MDDNDAREQRVDGIYLSLTEGAIELMIAGSCDRENAPARLYSSAKAHGPGEVEAVAVTPGVQWTALILGAPISRLAGVPRQKRHSGEWRSQGTAWNRNPSPGIDLSTHAGCAGSASKILVARGIPWRAVAWERQSPIAGCAKAKTPFRRMASQERLGTEPSPGMHLSTQAGCAGSAAKILAARGIDGGL